MNILIVNAYTDSLNGQKKFVTFCNLIKSMLKQVSDKSGIDNFLFIYRTPKTINDFLYTYDFNLKQNKFDIFGNKKEFDKIDIVFIDGDEKYLPWEDRSYNLNKFIKLCKLTNKVLYAGGVAMQILIYYLCTGSKNEYTFLNANGKYKSIEEIKDIPREQLIDVKRKDFFLDYVTGDVLEYHNVYNSWVPVVNIGLHHQLTAEKYMQRGRFVLPDSFKGKDYIKNKNIIICDNNHEIKVDVVKNCMSHFIVKDIPSDFVAYTPFTWFPHFTNFSYEKFQFKTICQSDKGPIVIEHENTIAVGFHPLEKYPETITILFNFVKNKFNFAQDKIFNFVDKNAENVFSDVNIFAETPPIFLQFKLNDEKINKSIILQNYFIRNRNNLKSSDSHHFNHNNKNIKNRNGNNRNKYTDIDKITDSTTFNRKKIYKRDAPYVGFGFNNRDMVFVENNCINQCNIQNSSNKKSLSKRILEKNVANNLFSLKKNENSRVSELFAPHKNEKELTHTFSSDDMFKNIQKDIIKDKNIEYLSFVNRKKLDENLLFELCKKVKNIVEDKLEEIDEEYKMSKSLPENKKKTHKPKLKIKLNKTSSGFYTHKDDKKTLKKNNTYTNLKIKKKMHTQNTVTVPINLNYKLMNDEYNKLIKGYNFPKEKIKVIELKDKLKMEKNEFKKHIRKCFSINDYNNIKEMKKIFSHERKELIEEKKKWMSNDDFCTVFGIKSTEIKPMPSIMGTGPSVNSHKYRDVHPEKWLTPNGFL